MPVTYRSAKWSSAIRCPSSACKSDGVPFTPVSSCCWLIRHRSLTHRSIPLISTVTPLKLRCAVSFTCKSSRTPVFRKGVAFGISLRTIMCDTVEGTRIALRRPGSCCNPHFIHPKRCFGKKVRLYERRIRAQNIRTSILHDMIVTLTRLPHKSRAGAQ